VSRRIDNVLTGADWTAAATVEQPETVAFDVVVANNAVAYQEGQGWPPQYGGPPKFLAPGGYSFRRAITSGVRFRDQVAGAHGSVTCELVSRYDDDPSLERIPRARRLEQRPSLLRSALGRLTR
jgi:hypothetical protein